MHWYYCTLWSLYWQLVFLLLHVHLIWRSHKSTCRKCILGLTHHSLFSTVPRILSGFSLWKLKLLSLNFVYNMCNTSHPLVLQYICATYHWCYVTLVLHYIGNKLHWYCIAFVLHYIGTILHCYCIALVLYYIGTASYLY